MDVPSLGIESASPPGRVIYDGFVNYRVFVQNGMSSAEFADRWCPLARILHPVCGSPERSADV